LNAWPRSIIGKTSTRGKGLAEERLKAGFRSFKKNLIMSRGRNKEVKLILKLCKKRLLNLRKVKNKRKGLLKKLRERKLEAQN
jgi:hypothetical protein